MNICLFTQEEINLPLKLSDPRAEHLIKILHKNEGDTFTAGVISGQSGLAKITKIIKEPDSKEKGRIEFEFSPSGSGKELFPLIMIIGFPRPIQLKRLLRDIAALGVCQVHLTGTELGEKSYMQSNLVESGNAYKMLLDGSVQAGSTHIAQLFLHKSLKECVESIEESSGKKLKLALDNINPACKLSQALTEQNISSVVAAIGSERGWTDKERKFLEDRGYIRCGMGERIMRTETAATVAGSIILSQLGFI
ncbi:MAG: RsmE family RNA methyltransferase [Treponema sp.]|nr:RsmE family RNA methyltransferase [Treponema sp.]